MEGEGSCGDMVIEESVAFPNGYECNHEKEADIGSAQLENLNEKTNENIKEEFKFKNNENQKKDISVEDPAQEAERGSPNVHDGNSIKIPNTNNPVCKVQLEPVGVQRNDSPINLNGVSERLKTLLSRNTPIKEKLEGVNLKNSQSRLIGNHSRSIDEDEPKLGWFEQRVTRSQSTIKEEGSLFYWSWHRVQWRRVVWFFGSERQCCSQIGGSWARMWFSEM
ncbi:hypothetical protein L1887_14739 [Cichorium endivia]|nr:hypothetical protein L1887_14739 [Cichorium endivia]